MSEPKRLTTVTFAVALTATIALSLLVTTGWIPVRVSAVEALATATGAWSVLLLSRNEPSGWFVGLASVSAFAWVFYDARLYAEVGIQVFYFVTSIQAIYLWLRGGVSGEERMVSRVPHRIVIITIPVAVVALVALRFVLIEINGAAPFWDALTTVMSLTAHIYLMYRFVESWYIWISVDIIYVPLYASRGLMLTSVLYVGFLVMSVSGLRTFRQLAPIREVADQSASP